MTHDQAFEILDRAVEDTSFSSGAFRMLFILMNCAIAKTPVPTCETIGAIIGQPKKDVQESMIEALGSVYMKDVEVTLIA